jgi:alcohol dehydrogenase class IV
MHKFDKARGLISQFKGEKYVYGFGVLSRTGQLAAGLGGRAALVRDVFPGADTFEKTIRDSLAKAGVELAGTVEGAAPNAPREDLARITASLKELNPEVIVSFGGGSTIDATKAAEVLRTLGGEIDEYFGTGMVSKALATRGKKLTPHVSIQTASSSSAQLTKYSNITDLKTGQKKLIVDEAIVPDRALFDYAVSIGSPRSLTVDGALDGIAHSLEVLFGAVGKPYYALMQDVAHEGREALGLGTDLGGYAIMLGGTNGAHLTSFSLIDILSHGRACGMLNPYYTVFFAPAVQQPLELVGRICNDLGYAASNTESLKGRALGEAVAKALIALETRIGVPVTLGEVSGFSDAHIERALGAAKDPQLKMKLENMPVPLTAEMVDAYMSPVLQAATSGDLGTIKNVA